MNLGRLRSWRNPHNLTAVHLAAASRRFGFSIGDHSYGRPKVRFAASDAKLTIGRFCSIADGVEILLGGNHRVEWVSTFPFPAFPERWPGAGQPLTSYQPTRGDVRIGSDVWVGSGALIFSGVTIGHGAVIAARACVTRDVPPYGIVAGNPAALVRFRFPEGLVAALLESAWWDLSDSEVAGLVPLIASPRVEDLVAAVRRLRAGGVRPASGLTQAG